VQQPRYLVAAAVLVVLAGVAVWVAGSRDPADVAGVPAVDEVLAEEPGPPAPELEADGWLNTDPLTAQDLEGEVVVYDFWTYSCVNCVRTVPFLRAWHDRYAEDGLVIVGVHSPEFEFEEDEGNVATAVDELGVTWPVALDPEMAIWNAFGNRFWPAKYVFDRDGRFRFNHFGEGAYDETEDILRSLLGVAPDSPRADDGQAEEPAPTMTPCPPTGGGGDCQTPELYLGSLRGGATFASPEGLVDGSATFTVPADQERHTVALEGSWAVGVEAVTSLAGGGRIVVPFTAAEVNLVMTPPVDGPVTAVVELDGEPVPEAQRPEGMTVDGGQTVVTIDESDLFGLLDRSEAGPGVITVSPRSAGLQAFAFTFGSS
jgi:thiol-disulfide isomerase/thioredoxin